MFLRALQIKMSCNSKHVIVNMEPQGHARLELQQRLSEIGLHPRRAAGYLCGCMISSGTRFAFKQLSGPEFSGIQKVIDFEKNLAGARILHSQARRSQ